MKNHKLILSLICLLLGIAPMMGASSKNTKPSFEAGDGTFLLNGEPFTVKAAELHYPRIPKEYWEHRIEMVKALGMNTVCLYVFWNAHEPQMDQFDFTGQNDIAEFIRLCEKHDMKVIVRPGPYVCAEWEMGGLPWWLLKKKDIRLREQDPFFMERVAKFEEKVAEQIGDLTIENGGPIIMVQVENEYGSYGTDKPYVAEIRDMLRKNWGDGVTLFQCDWSSNFENNGLDDLIWTMNFGTGSNIDQQFARLKELRPNSPLMCSEFWSGWFDKWGANHETRPAEDMVAGIDEMLSKGISFSLYMTHGGTSFGHWAGANSPGFYPDVTSYDYDAPITEWGTVTPKYDLLRQTLQKYTDQQLPEPPAANPIITVDQFSIEEFAPITAGIQKVFQAEDPMTFEDMDMGWGSAMYITMIPENFPGGKLKFNDLHDYAEIYINNEKIGSVDRVKAQSELAVPALEKNDTLVVLLEAMGRINFGRAIKDYKGITKSAELIGPNGTVPLKNWIMAAIPDDYEVAVQAFVEAPGLTNQGNQAGYYRGYFDLENVGDTFLDMSTWGKGQVWVNGHPLGRFWEIGPQQTLYLPGPWLKQGRNEVIVLDVSGPEKTISQGLNQPLLDNLNLNTEADDKLKALAEKASDNVAAKGTFAPGNGWQKVNFNNSKNGRYVVIEADNTYGDDYAAIAEVYVLDQNGNRLSREPWMVGATTETRKGNHTADKTIDLQESTFWQSAAGAQFPQSLIIDLGAPTNVTGIEYLPCDKSGAPGAIKEYQIAVF